MCSSDLFAAAVRTCPYSFGPYGHVAHGPRPVGQPIINFFFSVFFLKKELSFLPFLYHHDNEVSCNSRCLCIFFLMHQDRRLEFLC